MVAPEIIRQLVKRFEENQASYRSGNYNEARLRLEFLNPFFKALGWDIYNEQGYAEAYKDVYIEDSLDVEGAAKAPDYAFRIGGMRKFFVEAKKPAVNIQYDIYPAFQVRRYAWSAKLPLSILTDFEEFAVYESRSKPDKSDRAATGRVLLLNYKDYLARWDEIANIFSREAVLKGSFDQFAEGLKGKKGTMEVDDAFLVEIEGWRDILARTIALRNPDLQVRELNYAVQMTIDRIVFLRICEDRGIERADQLQELLEGDGVYERLCQLFRQADSRYNSGLFHFAEEKGQSSSPDDLTLRLKIDDRVLKDIISALYYPSPYVFREIPADILGQVYERFLGKVIRLTAGHQARVEEKPEVRKAGGVYYTPTYIVDYIVKNTVGKLLDPQEAGAGGKTPKEVASLKILDPACGSGSFLLGAYQYLLDWHIKWYSEHGPETWAKAKTPAIYQAQGGDWRLTTAEKKKILLNNIHGVDIDPQAVEVTKLSLSLKVLEGESQETIGAQLGLFKERALPDLGSNIKCGNSLIGPDYYEGRQLTMLIDEEERYRVKAFNWNAAFPQVFIGGGFDVVIGNPPYVRPHNLEPEAKDYFWCTYKSFVKKSDLYCCFMEKCVGLLKPNGLFSFIVSNGWLRLDSFEELRKILLSKTSLNTIIEFDDYVFEATVKTCIFVLSNGCKPNNKIRVANVVANSDLSSVKFREILQDAFIKKYKNNFDLSIDNQTEVIKQKIAAMAVSLGSKFSLSFGLKTGDDDLFLGMEKKSKQHKPILRGANIHRYEKVFKGEYVWYVPDKMTEHRRTARPGNAERFEQPKVLIRDTGGGLEGTYDDESYYVKDVLIVSHPLNDIFALKYLCGVLNSRLMKFYYETSFPTLHVQRDELASLPIIINFSILSEKAAHDKMVSLVERMLELHHRLPAARTPQEKEMLRGDVEATDAQIDRLVYELYGLTEDEIKVVEGRA
jgi:type I restriction-modification system DNA methylase subunit